MKNYNFALLPIFVLFSISLFGQLGSLKGQLESSCSNAKIGSSYYISPSWSQVSEHSSLASAMSGKELSYNTTTTLIARDRNEETIIDFSRVTYMRKFNYTYDGSIVSYGILLEFEKGTTSETYSENSVELELSSQYARDRIYNLINEMR